VPISAAKFKPINSYMNIHKNLRAVAVVSLWLASVSYTEASDRKAVINGSWGSHQVGGPEASGNWQNFMDRAPLGWSCYAAGTGGGPVPGLNWSPDDGP